MKVSLIHPQNLGRINEEVEVLVPEDLIKISTTQNWAPGTFKSGRRVLAELRSIELLVLDIDEGSSAQDVSEVLADYKHLILSSRNHLKEKNGVVSERFRVILWLNEPITNDRDYKATWKAFKEKLTFPIDEACKDSSRFFYPSPEVLFENPIGKSVDVVLAPKEEPIRAQAPANPEVKGDLWKSTLDFLLHGAPAGTRHNRLVSAVGNMKEQNYQLDEIIFQIEEMTTRADWTQVGLSDKDMKTIEDVFARPHKYEFKPKDSDLAEPVANFVSAKDLLDEAFEYLSDKDKVKGEPTGIEGLDKLLGGGLRTGELTVLMAQAKTGKNTFYHYLIYSYLKRGVPFGYASRELSPATEVIPNFLSIDTGTNVWKLEAYSDEYKGMVREAVANWPLYFAPGYGYFPVEEIEKWFVTMKEQGVNHFLFDHFHYALLGEDYEATARLIKKLKSITKELDIHLNLIVQPRSLRDGEKLSLATLRGGAAIGQALDNLLILERVRGQENISKLSLEVARHKLCKLGEIYLQYDPESTRFVEVEKQLIIEEPDPQEAYGGKFGGKGFRPYRLDG